MNGFIYRLGAWIKDRGESLGCPDIANFGKKLCRMVCDKGRI
jgi:hypothetical protein